MRRQSFDPAPRSYVRFVTPVRRSRRGPACAPAACSGAELEDWLVHEALFIDDFMALTEEFFWRIRATGAPLDRASFHVGTLHPQIAGYAWNWLSSDEIIDEVIVGSEARSQEAFLRNPLHRTFDYGETVRGDPREPETAERFPLLADLARQGVTDYVCRPIGKGGRFHNAATFGTFAPGRFSEAELARVNRVFDLYALHVDRHIATMISRNIADAYLGGIAGAEVLEGAIRRGAGRAIEAVIWVSDLRGFSERADRLRPDETTAMLNRYFEAMSGAVLAHGGEVLKFVGDGLLAVFTTAAGGPADAARRSLAAARAAEAAEARLNDAPPPDLPVGALPLKSGIALHLGEVFFGNVGAPDRLDFTVIGRAVNEASRVEALTKDLARPILVTEPVRALLDEPLEDMGARPLRGVARPMRIFAV